MNISSIFDNPPTWTIPITAPMNGPVSSETIECNTLKADTIQDNFGSNLIDLSQDNSSIGFYGNVLTNINLLNATTVSAAQLTNTKIEGSAVIDLTTAGRVNLQNATLTAVAEVDTLALSLPSGSMRDLEVLAGSYSLTTGGSNAFVSGTGTYIFTKISTGGGYNMCQLFISTPSVLTTITPLPAMEQHQQEIVLDQPITVQATPSYFPIVNVVQSSRTALGTISMTNSTTFLIQDSDSVDTWQWVDSAPSQGWNNIQLSWIV